MIRAFAALLLCAPLLATADTAAPDAIAGFWRTEGGEAIVEIRNAGAQYRGRLVWLRQPHYPEGDPRGIGGQPVTDRHNPDPARRDRPLIGLPLLTGLIYHVDDRGKAHWRSGRVYDTENGKHYDCNVWLADADHLKLRGYLGIELLGRTTTWERVDEPEGLDRKEVDS
ncbi:DUF2147 domain-containing protein [Salinisphaera aquimarina]|uniref:DUF2147 domain-containing protein n=1 Tax=Salinisphaera aquimarina TaxID=2094031 RepID=A0ABV7EWN9_9GAMM